MRDGLDKKCLQVLAQLIEQRLGWGIIQDWTQKDFQALSDQISSQVNDYVSVTTLKRAFGRVNYEGLPQQGTLNALAKYIGYANWSSFRQHCVSIGLREDDAPIPAQSQPLPQYPPVGYAPNVPPGYYPPAGNSIPLGGQGAPYTGQQPQPYMPGKSRPFYQANPQPVYYPPGGSVPFPPRTSSPPPAPNKPAVQLNVGPAPSIEQLMPDLLPKETPADAKEVSPITRQTGVPEVKTVKSNLGIRSEPEPIQVSTNAPKPSNETLPPVVSPAMVNHDPVPATSAPEPMAPSAVASPQQIVVQPSSNAAQAPPTQPTKPKPAGKVPKPKDPRMGSLEPMLSRALTPSSLTPELDGDNFNYEFWITSRKPSAKESSASPSDTPSQATSSTAKPNSAPQASKASTPPPQVANPINQDTTGATSSRGPGFSQQSSTASSTSYGADSRTSAPSATPYASKAQSTQQATSASATPAPFKVPRNIKWLLVGIVIGIMIGIMLGMNVTYPGRM